MLIKRQINGLYGTFFCAVTFPEFFVIDTVIDRKIESIVTAAVANSIMRKKTEPSRMLRDRQS